MIRAIVRDGVIQPLEPLPADWDEGREVYVDAVENPESEEELQQWLRDMNELTSQLDDPEEWRRFDEAIAEARAADKARMKREMGLP